LCGVVGLAVAGVECQPAGSTPGPSLRTEEGALPTYQYRCTECDHAFEQFQSFTDDALTVCPECGGRLRKVFNAVGVVFKGSGFYRTDSRVGAAASGGSADASSSTTGSESTSGSDKGAKSGSDSGNGSSSTGSSGPGKSGTGSSGNGSSAGGSASPATSSKTGSGTPA
jgi:putative FmdB family regulatory protein